jgi:hypothetical protein
MIDLSFWRFVIQLNFAKSLLWGKGEDTYLFHIGTFSRGSDTAIKIVILPISIMIGFVK